MSDDTTPTYRERRMAKAERLRGWADKRNTDAAAVFERNRSQTSDWAFITQPGHIPARARIIAQEDRAHESLSKARSMASRAAGIEDQAAGAIYSDDPDALEALTAKIAELEAKRERMKTENVAYRKAHKAELAAMTAYERGQAVPFASYQLTNLGGNIGRLKDRLIDVQRRQTRTAAAEAAGGVVVARNGYHGYVSVTFTDKPNQDTRDALKAAGFGFERGSWWGSGDKLPDGYTLPEL